MQPDFTEIPRAHWKCFCMHGVQERTIDDWAHMFTYFSDHMGGRYAYECFQFSNQKLKRKKKLQPRIINKKYVIGDGNNTCVLVRTIGEKHKTYQLVISKFESPAV